MKRLFQIFRKNPVLSGVFLGATILVTFFAVRSVLFALYWADPVHRDQAVAGWMTPRYVAHSWDVPPAVVGKPLGIRLSGGPPKGKPRNLIDIARDRGVPLSQVIEELESAIQDFRSRK